MTQKVEIVRPEQDFGDNLADFIQSMITLFLGAAVVMWLAPHTVYPLHPGYWESLLTIVVVRWFTTDPGQHLLWTRRKAY